MNEANTALLERIRSLKADHPAWGYRRIGAYLRHHDDLHLNHKRVHRLMQLHGLLVPCRRPRPAASAATTRKPRTVEPNRYWGIDMTKVMLPGTGWVYLHVVLDWGSKKLVGCTLARQSRARDWLAALDQAVNTQFPQGIREVACPPTLVSDHGSQPTSKAFMNACAGLRLDQHFASYNNPRGNADTERVIRTLKEDLIWPREFTSYEQLEQALADWVHAYNHDYPHSALGYDTPYDYERWFLSATCVA